jgi:hypothetical protein
MRGGAKSTVAARVGLPGTGTHGNFRPY